MNTDPQLSTDERTMSQSEAPSADFIHAISEFLDTDPSDLLVELGYYKREGGTFSERALADMTPQD